jgi:dipeptidyl-peptidase-4
MQRVFLTLLLCLGSIGLTQAQQQFQSFQEAVRLTSSFSSESGPSSVNWIDNGDRYSYLTYNEETGQQEIRAFNPKSDEDVLIFSAVDLTFPNSDESFTYESFQWAADSKHLLFKTNFRPIYRRSGIADYYFYSIEEKSLQLVAKDAGTAELSPDGSKVGFQRDNDLFFYSFETGEEVQLTNDGEEHVFNGKFGWVYEEEFGLAQAWNWSHDSRYISFWQEDERDVPIFQMTNYEGQHPEYVKIRYPKVGDTNPIVKIGVVDTQTGERVWMDIPEEDEFYVPRIYWTANEGTLAVTTLNREQNHLKLYFFDVTSGEGKLIMEETSDYWIDVFDFFAGINHFFFFPEDKKQFLWISDRDGFNHLYRYNYDGKMLNQITKGDWEVTYVHGVDADKKRIYYTSTEENPLERHLYRINFNGKGKKKISETAGRHSIDMSPNDKYYIDRYSNISQPTKVDLRNGSGKLLKNLADNSGAMEQHGDKISTRELFSFTTTDGQNLDGYIIYPAEFDTSQSYPLVLDIYGGPGAQGVYNNFGLSGWQQYLADQGFIVANVNNRGSGGYGRTFEKMVYKQLGKWEANDFVETAKFLGEMSYVDAERMAIRGHSYGGYMTTYTLANHPDVFKAGVSAAPVTDWRLYDSIYTERYMGLLDENTEGYVQTASTSNAGNVNDELFLAHSTMDENVHVQNTFQFITALASAGIDADVRIYPPGAHGVAFDRNSYFLLYETYVEFLNEHLK